MIKIEELKREALCNEVKLLQILDELAEPDGAVEGFNLDELALEVGVSRNTLKSYLREYRDSGALKFKFSGKIRLNPDIFTLTTSDLAEARAKYKYLESD